MDSFEPIAAVAIIIAVIAVLIFIKKKNGSESGTSRIPGVSTAENVLLRPMADYKKLDPGFDSSRFEREVSGLYVENLEVLDVMARGWKQEEGWDRIFATIRARVIEHTGDDNNGQAASVNEAAGKVEVYEWELERESGNTASDWSLRGVREISQETSK